MTLTVVAPDRSLQQRRDALARANAVRVHRRLLKEGLVNFTVDPAELVAHPDDLCATWRIQEVLIAVPAIGRTKTAKILNHVRVSPSKTLAGLSPRQRQEIVDALREHVARSRRYRGVSFRQAVAA